MDNRAYFLNEQKVCKKASPLLSSWGPVAGSAPPPQQQRLHRSGSQLTEQQESNNEEGRFEHDQCRRATSVTNRERCLISYQTQALDLKSAPGRGGGARHFKRGKKMGVTFRDSYSEGSVIIGKRTIKDGECCGVWDMAGKYKVILGPKRKWFFFSRVCFMDRRVADSHQYLEVRFRNGKKDNLRGPLAMFEDPVLHESITVMNAVTVDAFEVIVVYSEDENGNVKRNVVHGPTVFIPAVNQWLHVFRWHGSKDDDLYSKIPGTLVFTKLRTIPDQFYYNAEGVRTADDASLTVKVMVFFQLTNLELMLNGTHDPIGDFINAILADLMNFGSAYTYEQFIQHAQQLSELDTFPVLCSRAAAIGFTVGKVVYRGYTASKQLQSLCDQAIKCRTELKLKAEEDEQRERMRDHELRSSTGRGNAERKEEVAKQEHRLTLEAAKHRDNLRKQDEAHSEGLRQQKERVQAELDAKVAAEKAHIAYLDGLKGLGVDLTQYLVSSVEQRPDKVLKVLVPQQGGGGGVAEMMRGLNIHTNV